MIGRRTAVGLSLLCALLFSAIAVQSASAAKAVNTTAFTCVAKAKGDFSDSHCDTKVAAGTGSFAHEVISNDQTTKIEHVQLSNAVFKTKAAGATVEITCTVVKSTGELHNVETPTNKHTVTGTLTTTFESCTVNKPTKCIVHEPFVTEAAFEGVEGLGFGNEMGVEYKPTKGDGVFVSVTFTDKKPGVEECSIEGTFPITGTKVATGAPSPTAQHSGATSIFTDAMTTETLKFGLEKLGLSLETTVRMDPNEGPIALTTVT